MVAMALKHEFGVAISGTKTPTADWVRASLRPVTFRRISARGASIYGFCVMIRDGGLLKSGTRVCRVI